VLEREAETLEVLRCRLPWAAAHAHKLPHAAGTAQTWEYPAKLEADAGAMRAATAVEQQLPAVYNSLLQDLAVSYAQPSPLCVQLWGMLEAAQLTLISANEVRRGGCAEVRRLCATTCPCQQRPVAFAYAYS